jgi:hypothetical protein
VRVKLACRVDGRIQPASELLGNSPGAVLNLPSVIPRWLARPILSPSAGPAHGKNLELVVFKAGIATELQARADRIYWIDDLKDNVRR